MACVNDGDGAFSGSDDDGNFDVLSAAAVLRAPYATCWAREGARRMFPDMTDDTFALGKLVLGRLGVVLAPRRMLRCGADAGDRETIFWPMDIIRSRATT